MGVQASLVYTAPDGTKQDLMLNVGEDTTIGRHPNCSLTISQPSVSRRHARLWYDQGVWFVEDLQSSNGTFVNNRRINRAQLTEGDELRCGDFLLTYGVEEKTRAVPTPERRELQPPVSPSPQVSNRATVGLDSPPPIPEAPRLNPPRPPTPTPAPSAPAAPAPAAPAAPAAPPPSPAFDPNDGKIAELEAALEASKKSESDAQKALSDCRKSLDESRDARSAIDDETNRLNETIATLQQERDAAKRDVERLEEQRARLESEISKLSTQNRDLDSELEGVQDELDQLRADMEAQDSPPTSENAEQSRTIAKLEKMLAAKEDDLAVLKKDLEDMHLQAPTKATAAKEQSGGLSSEANQALASHSSELRVALKAASGFVQEVKDVFQSVASIETSESESESVSNVQETFEENGGMDPVNSLEVAFDKMEQTARQLRRLSKGR